MAAVLPLPGLKALPGAPAGVAGVANYQGKPVPVIDLSDVATGRAAADRLSTRLVLVRYPAKEGGRLLGLVAERATSVTRLDEKTFASTGVEAAPWLGRVTPAAGALAQRVEIEALLPPDLRAVLFQAVEEPA
ncbi:MAG: chemotaxis protein CheW [Rariglobus sp.]|nr:chemotaxis protein CheW [Rariglobus sp.]